MKFKGIIFDLDGTLVNSLGDLADSMNIVLEKYGFPSHELQEYKLFIGNGLKNLVYEALPEESRDENLLIECYDSMMKEYRKNCINKTQPYDGILELLEELAASEMKLAVFSNKVDDLTKKVVKALLPNHNFEVILGASSEIPRKPSPIGALQISQQLRLSPEELIYVGDTDVDMKTANSAGMFSVGVLWGFRTKEELSKNGARYLLNHPWELIQMLKEI